MTNVTEEKTELKRYFADILKRYECASEVNRLDEDEEVFDWVTDSENYYEMPMKEWKVGERGHLLMKHFLNIIVYLYTTRRCYHILLFAYFVFIIYDLPPSCSLESYPVYGGGGKLILSILCFFTAKLMKNIILN